MALVKFGHLIADARGKLNGTVFSHNRGGSYMRTKVTPTNPATSFQTAVRNSLTAAAQAWRSLTDIQRQGWISLSTQLTRTNVFGDNKFLSGFSTYVRLNANLLKIGEAQIPAAPVPLAVTAMATLSIAADASASTLIATFTLGTVGDTSTFVVEATPQMSPGIGFFKGKFRQLTTFAEATASPFALGTLYETRFGDMVVGNRINVQIYKVSDVTGLQSLPLQATTIVVV